MTHKDIVEMAEAFVDDVKSGRGTRDGLIMIHKALKGIRDNYNSFAITTERQMTEGYGTVRLIENFGNVIKIQRIGDQDVIRTNLFGIDLGVNSSCTIHNGLLDYDVRRYFTTLVRLVNDYIYKGGQDALKGYMEERARGVIKGQIPDLKFSMFGRKLKAFEFDCASDELLQGFSYQVEQVENKSLGDIALRLRVMIEPRNYYTWMGRPTVMGQLMDPTPFTLNQIEKYGTTFEVGMGKGEDISEVIEEHLALETISVLNKFETFGTWAI